MLNILAVEMPAQRLLPLVIQWTLACSVKEPASSLVQLEKSRDLRPSWASQAAGWRLRA